MFIKIFSLCSLVSCHCRYAALCSIFVVSEKQTAKTCILLLDIVSCSELWYWISACVWSEMSLVLVTCAVVGRVYEFWSWSTWWSVGESHLSVGTKQVLHINLHGIATASPVFCDIILQQPVLCFMILYCNSQSCVSWYYYQCFNNKVKVCICVVPNPGWPLVWKTWKCQEIWQVSGKCQGFY